MGGAGGVLLSGGVGSDALAGLSGMVPGPGLAAAIERLVEPLLVSVPGPTALLAAVTTAGVHPVPGLLGLTMTVPALSGTSWIRVSGLWRMPPGRWSSTAPGPMCWWAWVRTC